MPGPSRLEDPYFYSGTVIVEKDGITTEILTRDLAHYEALGYTVVGPGKPVQQTSYIDKQKVREFHSIKRFFWVKSKKPKKPAKSDSGSSHGKDHDHDV